MINSILLGMFGLGAPEITLVVIALVLLFGGRKIPELMKGLGKGIKEFKDASKGVDSDVDSKTPEKKS